MLTVVYTETGVLCVDSGVHRQVFCVLSVVYTETGVLSVDSGVH